MFKEDLQLENKKKKDIMKISSHTGLVQYNRSTSSINAKLGIIN